MIDFPCSDDDEVKVNLDLLLHGIAFTRDGKHIPISEIYLTPEEVKSPNHTGKT